MDKVEATPLMDAEWTEDDVADGTTRAEDGFGLCEELVYADEAYGDLVGKLFAGERRRASGRADG